MSQDNSNSNSRDDEYIPPQIARLLPYAQEGNEDAIRILRLYVESAEDRERLDREALRLQREEAELEQMFELLAIKEGHLPLMIVKTPLGTEATIRLVDTDNLSFNDIIAVRGHLARNGFPDHIIDEMDDADDPMTATMTLKFPNDEVYRLELDVIPAIRPRIAEERTAAAAA